MWDLTYEQALDKSKHLIALGQTTVYLRDENVPWMVASDVEASGSYRFNGPTGCYIIANVQGLTFKWSVDFELRDANGRGVSLFDRDRLREVARKLPAPAREQFGKLLRDEVLPDMQKRTREIREGLNQQVDSEDCVRGLIAFAFAKEAEAA
jgi:hypothetical protein